jgi:hypothetical protein
MHPGSPYFDWTPASVGWLHRKHRDGTPVFNEEVIGILGADISAAADPVMQRYILPAMKGELPASRGRRPGGVVRAIKLLIAKVLIEDRAAEIKAERRLSGQKHRRGDLEPGRQAAGEVARFLGFHITEAALLNAISKDSYAI